ncbi:MAG: RNA 2',3'-cyclic phosphodiesterase [Candidatus Nealsonbacteria bacterium]|nr:RNA 2',3'-cyclic phosphodiesterase [Candidatus Nealsonbacteria bacterium]
MESFCLLPGREDIFVNIRIFALNHQFAIRTNLCYSLEVMRHRIFLAINLPPHIKDKLEGYQIETAKAFNGVSPKEVVRWVPKDNIHITLVFMGSVQEQALPQILKTTEEIVEEAAPFVVQIEGTVYGPPGKMPPRMVWLRVKKTDPLLEIQGQLSDALLAPSQEGGRKPRRRPYSPHITLGRIKKWEFKKIEPEDRPDIKKDLYSDFQVNSIEVMESKLKRSGAEYTVLQSVPLSGTKKY